jgi:hypothetical protein
VVSFETTQLDYSFHSGDLPNRPHEVDQSKKVPDPTSEDVKRFEQIQHQVEEMRKNTETAAQPEEQLSPQTISKLFENQFRILESLRVLEEKVNAGGSSGHSTGSGSSDGSADLR